MANGTIKTKQTLQGSISSPQQTKAVVTGGGGTADHSRLINRDKVDQHPISAITGLQKLLNSKLDSETALPIINDAAKNKAAGLFFDVNKELAKKSYWYLTSAIDPITKMGTKESVISGPYDLGAGGGGSGSSTGGVTTVTLTKTNPETLENMWPTAVAVGSSCEVGIYWTSLKDAEATGSGAISLYVNDKLISKKTYKQGIVLFDISENIVSGDNKVEVRVTDAYSTTKNLIATITGVTLTIESTFDDSIAYQGDILYTYKAFGDIEKTVHFIIDGKELEPAIVRTTGETSNYLLKNLSHGSHTLLVYFTAVLAGDEVNSNSLYYDLIHFVNGNNTPIIASTFLENSEAEQYVSFNLPYRVYTPGKNLSDIDLYINGVKYGETLSVDQALHFWAYRPLDIGNYILEIRTGDVRRAFNVHAIESQVKVELATTGLSMALNADGRSNAEPIESRLKWEDKDHAISCNLSGFNWSSNGWMTDKNNNPILRLAGSARVEIPYKPFAKDFTQTGKTFEFEIATSDIKAYDSMIIQCLDGGDAIDKNVWLTGEDDRTKKFTIENLDETLFLNKILKEYGSYVFTYRNGSWTLDNIVISEEELINEYGITLAHIDLDSSDPSTEFFMEGDRFAIDYKVVGMGFYITPQLAKLQAQQTSLSTQYKEDDNVRLTFVVENRQENRLVSMYINGIMSGVTVYPSSESFRQTTPQNITIGSSDAAVDIYNLRIYDTALSRKQVVNNWIADTQDIILKSDRFYNNDNYDETGNIVINKLPGTTPYMVLTAEKLPSYKKDKKPVDVEFVYPGDETRSFTSVGATADVQGTSSQYYYRKNFKVKFENGFIDNDGNIEKKYKIQGPISKKEKTFTFKADVASSEGTNNVELVRYFENTKNWYSPAELDQDPEDTADGYETKDRIRVGIDGFPMVMFHDAGNGPKFYGKMNFNNDKANDSTFGFIEGDECWEFTNNSSKLVLFKTNDISDWANSFESRYPEDVADDNGIEHAFGTVPGETDKLASVVAWVNSTERLDTDSEEVKAAKLAKFKNELESKFNLTSSLFYYLYTELFLMVDSRAKNAMLAYYKSRNIGDGGNKWFWIPYDMDTALGINNEGLLVFDYDVEDTDLVHGANVYNGQQSVFWNNIRDAYKDELTKMYADLRANVWSFDTIEKMYEDHQAVWSESIFNEDSYTKYLEPLILNSDASYLGMAQGSKAEQRRWWLFNRFRYLDSKYRTGDAADQNIMLRVYKKGNLTITPYINCHVTAIYDQAANFVTVDAEKNVPVILESPASWDPNNSDAVLAIYSADMLKDVGDLSTFKPGYANFSAATKLQKLKIGSIEPGYTNEKLTGIMVGNNHLLTEIDARNCTNLGSNTSSVPDASATPTIDLSGCVSIERAYFDNTKILGVQFPVGGYLQEVHLPGSITMLEIRNHPSLKVLKLDGTNNLQSLWLENISSEAIDAYSIISQMKEGCAVRLIGINNTMTPDQIKAFYDRIDKMKGKDLHGDDTETAQVTGQINVDSIAYHDFIELSARYTEVTIKPNKIICTVNFWNENTLFKTQQIISGYSASNPGIPQKASNIQYTYAFEKWDKSYALITEDMDINAIFIPHIQIYKVIFDPQSNIKLDEYFANVEYNNLCPQPSIKSETIPEHVELIGWFYENGITEVDFANDKIDHNITIYAHWKDEDEPTIHLTRVAFNKFKYECLDNVGVNAWAVKRTNETPTDTEWTEIPVTTDFIGEYTIDDAGDYYLFTKDAEHVVSAKIQAESIDYNIAEGIIGNVLFENEIAIGNFALSGTTAVIKAECNEHYEGIIMAVNEEFVEQNSNITINSNITLNVDCSKKIYTITFYTDRGILPNAQHIAYNDYAKLPDPQFNDGYVIDGWFLDNETFANEFNFLNTTISENLSLYAKWVAYVDPTILTIKTESDAETIQVAFQQTEANGVEIDWGDGTATEFVGYDGYVSLAHSYATSGTYQIKLYLRKGEYYLGQSSDVPTIMPITALTNIYIAWNTPNTLPAAFKGAINLTSCGFSAFTTNIVDSEFYGCTGLTSLELPYNLLTIGDGAFSYCSNITGTLKTNPKLKHIGAQAFSHCVKIEAINLVSRPDSIGEYAFTDCEALIQIPDNLPAVLNRGTFAGCSSLTEVVIPGSIIKLAGYVFADCDAISKVKLLNAELQMGDGLNFNNCPKLTTIGPINTDLSYDIEYAWQDVIPDAAFAFSSDGGSNIENIVLLDSITSIGNSSFAGNTKLRTLALPSNLESIGNDAFFFLQSLSEIDIPATVRHIGKNFASYCYALDHVYLRTPLVLEKVESTQDLWFIGVYSAKLHIPAVFTNVASIINAYGALWNYKSDIAYLNYKADIYSEE